eukprot:502905-Pelagomonas_calceolata.AAC.8
MKLPPGLFKERKSGASEWVLFKCENNKEISRGAAFFMQGAMQVQFARMLTTLYKLKPRSTELHTRADAKKRKEKTT